MSLSQWTLISVYVVCNSISVPLSWDGDGLFSPRIVNLILDLIVLLDKWLLTQMVGGTLEPADIRIVAKRNGRFCLIELSVELGMSTPSDSSRSTTIWKGLSGRRTFLVEFRSIPGNHLHPLILHHPVRLCFDSLPALRRFLFGFIEAIPGVWYRYLIVESSIFQSVFHLVVLPLRAPKEDCERKGRLRNGNQFLITGIS